MNFNTPTAKNSSKTAMQTVLGGAFITSCQLGCVTDDGATNFLLPSQAKRSAKEIAVPAATKLNQSYRPGSQKRALFATKSANRLRKKKNHFIATCFISGMRAQCGL